MEHPTPPAVNYPAFVINLDRQPQRLDAFRKWNAECDLSIERFSATEGRGLSELDRRALATSGDFSIGMMGSTHSHKSLWERAIELGRPVMIFEDDAVIRVDAGAVLSKLISGIGGFWDIILLGFNTDSFLIVQPGEYLPPFLYSRYPTQDELEVFRTGSEETRLARLAYTYGICGYVVTPTGARKLLERCFPMTGGSVQIPTSRGYPYNSGQAKPTAATPYQSIVVNGIDSEMNKYYLGLDAYICVPPLVLSPNEQVGSGTK